MVKNPSKIKIEENYKCKNIESRLVEMRDWNFGLF